MHVDAHHAAAPPLRPICGFDKGRIVVDSQVLSEPHDGVDCCCAVCTITCCCCCLNFLACRYNNTGQEPKWGTRRCVSVRKQIGVQGDVRKCQEGGAKVLKEPHDGIDCCCTICTIACCCCHCCCCLILSACISQNNKSVQDVSKRAGGAGGGGGGAAQTTR
jgi:hypothetical protein